MKNVPIQRPVVLAGQKVVLRDLKVEDVTQDYVDWMNDPEVVRYTESRFFPHDLCGTREFARSFQSSLDTILFGIFSPEEGLHLGNIKLGPIHWHHALGDMGIIVGRKSFWGKGIATEAISLVCGYAFTELGLHKVTAGCYASNGASARAFLRAGFRQEALRPEHAMGESGWEDVLEFGLCNPRHPAEVDK